MRLSGRIATSGRQPRVVVDTNLLVSSALSTLGLPFALLHHLVLGAFTLVISSAMRAELIDVLHRPRFATRFGLTAQTRDDLLLLVDTLAEIVEPATDVPVQVRDVKDVMVLATATSGQADYLVTGDRDLLDLSGHPALGALRIVTVQELLAILDA